jgi:hypothetical protein
MHDQRVKYNLIKPEPVFDKNAPIEDGVQRNVRYSNNPQDHDLDILKRKLMRTRFFHKEFNPVFTRKDVKQSLKDFVF